MKDLLKQFIKYYDTNEEFQSELKRYDRVMQTNEWKFQRDVLITIKSTIMHELLTAKHTDLQMDEKDVMQRTYYSVNLLLDFLLQPINWIAYRKKRFAAFTNLKGKIKSIPNRKENEK